MKTNIATTLALACSAVLAIAADSTPGAKQLEGFPKNLARQHLSSNLFVFDQAKGSFVATEAAAAWLDDDIATGWAALPNKQHYLLQFSEPEVVTNLSLSTNNSNGTITVYTADEMKNPGDAAWKVLAKDVPISSINQKKLAKSFNRMAKYLLIETNIAEPGPIYSLYVYGQRAAANEAIARRVQPVDVTSVLGEFVNGQTSFNVTSLYAQARVTYANGGGTQVAWQKAIDDNAESVTAIKAGTDSSMVVRFAEPRTVSRISLLADSETKGKAEIFLLADKPEAGTPVALEGATPSMTLSFDGSNARANADFADTNAAGLAVRWVPETAGQTLAVRELNTFADISLAEYEVASAPTVIAEEPAKTPETAKVEKTEEARPSDSEESSKKVTRTDYDGKDMAPIGEGKETVDFKGGPGKSTKEVNPPIVGAGPGPTGYFPGGLGFPPNLSTARGRVLVPGRRVNPPTSNPQSP